MKDVADMLEKSTKNEGISDENLQILKSLIEKEDTKKINCSISDIFDKEVSESDTTTTLMLSLLEIGNTIDGVMIGHKLFEKKKTDSGQSSQFSMFLDWTVR